MQNLRKHVDIKIVTNDDQALRYANKPNFAQFTIIDENTLALTHMRKTKIKFDRPYPVGPCILELARLHMYRMLYDYVKPKWGDRVELLMTDTDSLVLEIRTKDVYEDIKDDIPELFDTSNYPKDHPLYTEQNKKVLGRFKEKTGGKQMIEFCGANAKHYSELMDDGDNIKKCKGIKRAVKKKTLQHEDYKRCVLINEDQMRRMNIIRSHQHQLFTETMYKVTLSNKDDKRVICEDSIHTYAHGHYETWSGGSSVSEGTT